MEMVLSIHDTDPKLWLALAETHEVKTTETGHTKWVDTQMGDYKLTFYGPRK